MCYRLYLTTFNSCLIKVINVDCYNSQYFKNYHNKKYYCFMHSSFSIKFL